VLRAVMGRLNEPEQIAKAAEGRERGLVGKIWLWLAKSS